MNECEDCIMWIHERDCLVEIGLELLDIITHLDPDHTIVPHSTESCIGLDLLLARRETEQGE